MRTKGERLRQGVCMRLRTSTVGEEQRNESGIGETDWGRAILCLLRPTRFVPLRYLSGKDSSLNSKLLENKVLTSCYCLSELFLNVTAEFFIGWTHSKWCKYTSHSSECLRIREEVCRAQNVGSCRAATAREYSLEKGYVVWNCF